MITAKRLRVLLLIYLAVVMINSAYGMWRGVSPIPHPLSTEQKDALASVNPSPVFTAVLTAVSFTSVCLGVWGWIGLFTLRASGRACFIASVILSFAVFPLLASWAAPASSSTAFIGSGLVKLPGLLETMLGNFSLLLSGALVAITYSDPGSSLFKR